MLLCEFASTFQEAKDLLYDDSADIVLMKISRAGIDGNGRRMPGKRLGHQLITLDKALAEKLCTHFGSNRTLNKPPYTFAFAARYTAPDVLNMFREAIPDACTRSAFLEAVLPNICNYLSWRFRSLGRGFVIWSDPAHPNKLLLAYQWSGINESTERCRKVCFLHTDTMRYALFCTHGFQQVPSEQNVRWRAVHKATEEYLQKRGLKPLKPF